jgi:hypothetical protein
MLSSHSSPDLTAPFVVWIEADHDAMLRVLTRTGFGPDPADPRHGWGFQALRLALEDAEDNAAGRSLRACSRVYCPSLDVRRTCPPEKNEGFGACTLRIPGSVDWDRCRLH